MLRGALSPAEVAAVGGLGDAAQELTDHPTILSYASLLCGEEAVLDLPPAHLEERQQAAGALTGAEYERARWGRAYTHRGGTRICLGIDVVVSLEEEFVYRLCPGTHQSLAPLPSDYTSAGPPSDDDPLLRSVPLQPGDVLLAASTVLGRGSGPAITFSFRSASARPADPQPGVAPSGCRASARRSVRRSAGVGMPPLRTRTGRPRRRSEDSTSTSCSSGCVASLPPR